MLHIINMTPPATELFTPAVKSGLNGDLGWHLPEFVEATFYCQVFGGVSRKGFYSSSVYPFP